MIEITIKNKDLKTISEEITHICDELTAYGEYSCDSYKFIIEIWDDSKICGGNKYITCVDCYGHTSKRVMTPTTAFVIQPKAYSYPDYEGFQWEIKEFKSEDEQFMPDKWVSKLIKLIPRHKKNPNFY